MRNCKVNDYTDTNDLHMKDATEFRKTVKEGDRIDASFFSLDGDFSNNQYANVRGFLLEYTVTFRDCDGSMYTAVYKSAVQACRAAHGWCMVD